MQLNIVIKCAYSGRGGNNYTPNFTFRVVNVAAVKNIHHYVFYFDVTVESHKRLFSRADYFRKVVIVRTRLSTGRHATHKNRQEFWEMWFCLKRNYPKCISIGGSTQARNRNGVARRNLTCSTCCLFQQISCAELKELFAEL